MKSTRKKNSAPRRKNPTWTIQVPVDLEAEILDFLGQREWRDGQKTEIVLESLRQKYKPAYAAEALRKIASMRAELQHINSVLAGQDMARHHTVAQIGNLVIEHARKKSSSRSSEKH